MRNCKMDSLVRGKVAPDSIVCGNINKQINDGLSIARESVMNDISVQVKVVNRIVENKIVAEVEKKYDTSLVDIDSELVCFLSKQNSEVTANNYRRWVGEYISWAREKNINPVGITRVEVDSYMVYLLNKNSPNSVRCKLLGISSFYSFLQARNDVIRLNPFSKLKLPKGKKTRKIDIITADDIAVLRKEMVYVGRKDIVCAIDMMCKYGYRVGLFECMKVDPNGNWTSEDKEDNKQGKFGKKEAEEIIASGVLGMSGNTITSVFKRYSAKLYEEGKIGSSFSPHDIRSWHLTYYGKNLTMEEFLKFSKKFHKNPLTTMGYMRFK